MHNYEKKYLLIGQSTLFYFFNFEFFCIFSKYFLKKMKIENIAIFSNYGKLSSNIFLFLLISIIFIVPDLLLKQLYDAEQQFYSEGYSDEEVKKMIYFAKKFTSPLGISLLGLIQMSFFTLIISLIMPVFYINKKND